MGCDLDFSLQLDIWFSKIVSSKLYQIFFIANFLPVNYFIECYWPGKSFTGRMRKLMNVEYQLRVALRDDHSRVKMRAVIVVKKIVEEELLYSPQ